MDYFDDLNPYLIRQEDVESPITPSTNPGAISQAYLGNIIKLNVGKLGTFYFTYSDSTKWRDKSYVGVVEEAGRDYFIIREQNSEKRIILSYVYLLWSQFDEPLDYEF